MFEVAVLIYCFAMQGQPICVEYVDKQGPYETVEQCDALLEKVLTDANLNKPITKWKAACGNTITGETWQHNGPGTTPTLITPIPMPMNYVIEAQLACGLHKPMVAKLETDYGEVRKGGGIAGGTAIFEVFANNETGSWTILKTSTNGSSCVMAVGEGWSDDKPKAAGSPV